MVEETRTIRSSSERVIVIVHVVNQALHPACLIETMCTLNGIAACSLNVLYNLLKWQFVIPNGTFIFIYFFFGGGRRRQKKAKLIVFVQKSYDAEQLRDWMGDKQNYISFLMADPKLLPTIPGIVMGILYYRQTNICPENQTI